MRLCHKVLALVVICGCALPAWGQTVELSGSYGQNFNSLASSGTFGSAMPAGWSFVEQGDRANPFYRVYPGGFSTADYDTYSFGGTPSPTGEPGDRSIGRYVNPTNVSAVTNTSIQVGFTNTSGVALSGISLTYRGEQWWTGPQSGALDQMVVQYSKDPSQGWTTVDALTFFQLVTEPSDSPLNGNVTNRVISGNIVFDTPWQPKDSLFVQWTGATGLAGLAIDDVYVQTVPVAEPVHLMLCGVVGLVVVDRVRRFRRSV
jgi:hypothetical protein